MRVRTPIECETTAAARFMRCRFGTTDYVNSKTQGEGD